MTVLEPISSWPLVQAIGWTLLHFIWQGALVAAAVAVVLAALRRDRPGTRYLVGLGGMAVMMALPVVTFFILLVAPSGGSEAAAAAPAPIPAGPLAPLLSGLTIIWLVGACGLQGRSLLRWARAERMRVHGTRPAPAPWTRTCATLARRLRVRRPVRILESARARVPTLIGWLRPVILVPSSAFTGLSPDQLRAVIAHELAHVRRHDYLVNLVQAVFESMLFFHPAVWWLSNRLRIEREFCCDDIAVDVCGDRACYARALSSLDTMSGELHPPILASTGGSLMNRILRLAGVRNVPTYRVGEAMAVAVTVLAVAVTASTMALAAEERGTDRLPKVQELLPIDRINLAEIVQEVDSDRAAVVAALADSGVDNRTLLFVLRRMGTDERVFATIDRAAAEAGREAKLQHRYLLFKANLAEKVAAGELTEDEAQARHEGVRKEMAAHRRQLREERSRDERLHLRIREMEERGMSRGEIEVTLTQLHKEEQAKRIAHAVANMKEQGRSTYEIEVAVRKMKQERDRNVHERKRAHRDQDIEAKLHAVHEELRAAIAAGRITEEEARKRLDGARRELHGVREYEELRAEHRRRIGKMRAEGMSNKEIEHVLHGMEQERHERGRWTTDHEAEVVVAKITAASDRISDQLAAGEITPKMAEVRLRHLREALEAVRIETDHPRHEREHSGRDRDGRHDRDHDRVHEGDHDRGHDRDHDHDG